VSIILCTPYFTYNFAVGTASVELDVLPWLSRSALDCICEGVLGYHSNAIDTGNNNEYTEAVRMLGCVCWFASESVR
jgi:hypothetical protein